MRNWFYWWSKCLKTMEDWNDIHLQVTGKVVNSLLRSFARSYIICGGKRKAVRKLLKLIIKMKKKKLIFIFDEAKEKKSKARHKYIEALKNAQRKVVFFSPYYFPDKYFCGLCGQQEKKYKN
jgi:phosphatidylserine/phosphatidylglycerophosphate/cardiolipin synthase-like enzyme